MTMSDIEKQSAKTLPDYIRSMVLKECREQTKVSGMAVAVFLIISVLFIGGGATIVLISGGKLSAIILTAFFVAVSALMGYLSFVKPRKLLKMAEEDRYECYTGRMTDKLALTGDDKTYYRLVLDGAVEFGCTEEQYKKAGQGEEYIAVFFGKNIPELFLKISQKDRV